MFVAKSRAIVLKCGGFAKSHSMSSKLAKSTQNLNDQHELLTTSSAHMLSLRLFATKTTGSSQTADKHLDQQRVGRSILEEVMIKEEQQPKSTAQKVKKGAENTFFYASLAVSIAALGGLSYLLFEYFFSNGSPQRVYSKALKMIRNDSHCQAVLGEEIAGFGEQSRRSRRHIASHAYRVGEEERVRVTFHVKGTRNAGRAFAEVSRKPGESWEYRFLFIEIADRSDTIVLIDNRN